jgi:geranylgeranyl diphosphate synthase type II
MSKELKPSAENLENFLKIERDRFNRELDRLLPGENEYPEILHRAIRHSVFAGGKRLRPILVRSVAEGFRFRPEIIYPAGAAIEMIHTYSLMHDDLPALDDDDLRRGKPTCHKKYGEAVAILAGDALNSHAFGILASLPYEDEMKDASLRVIKELSEYAGLKGMIRGQIVDWISMNKEIEPETLRYMHRNKTAALIVCSLRAGAILSNADENSLAGLTKLGELIGLAFQIKDDILDVESTSEELGKSIGKDRTQGKATYPAVFGMERSKRELKQLTTEAKEIAEKFAKNCPWLYYIIEYLLQRRN